MSRDVLLNEHADLSSIKRRTGILDLPERWRTIYGRALFSFRQDGGSPTPSGLPGSQANRKRQRTVSIGSIPPEIARVRRLEEIWRTCSSILLKKLWQNKNATPFLQPVDPAWLGIPDYFNYVNRPMDLRTIKERLATMHYPSPLEFRDDVRQVWLNCTLYNHPNTPVRVMGDILSDLWERAWLDSNVEAAWRDFELRHGVGAAAAPTAAAAAPGTELSRRSSFAGAESKALLLEVAAADVPKAAQNAPAADLNPPVAPRDAMAAPDASIPAQNTPPADAVTFVAEPDVVMAEPNDAAAAAVMAQPDGAAAAAADVVMAEPDAVVATTDDITAAADVALTAATDVVIAPPDVAMEAAPAADAAVATPDVAAPAPDIAVAADVVMAALDAAADIAMAVPDVAVSAAADVAMAASVAPSAAEAPAEGIADVDATAASTAPPIAAENAAMAAPEPSKTSAVTPTPVPDGLPANTGASAAESMAPPMAPPAAPDLHLVGPAEQQAPQLPLQLPPTEPPLGVPDEATSAFIERRKLALRMVELPGEHLQAVLDIVLLHEPCMIFNPSDPEHEVVLDLDLLRPDTLSAIRIHLDRLAAQAPPRWPAPLKMPGGSFSGAAGGSTAAAAAAAAAMHPQHLSMTPSSAAVAAGATSIFSAAPFLEPAPAAAAPAAAAAVVATEPLSRPQRVLPTPAPASTGHVDSAAARGNVTDHSLRSATAVSLGRVPPAAVVVAQPASVAQAVGLAVPPLPPSSAGHNQAADCVPQVAPPAQNVAAAPLRTASSAAPSRKALPAAAAARPAALRPASTVPEQKLQKQQKQQLPAKSVLPQSNSAARLEMVGSCPPAPKASTSGPVQGGQQKQQAPNGHVATTQEAAAASTGAELGEVGGVAEAAAGGAGPAPAPLAPALGTVGSRAVVGGAAAPKRQGGPASAQLPAGAGSNGGVCRGNRGST